MISEALELYIQGRPVSNSWCMCIDGHGCSWLAGGRDGDGGCHACGTIQGGWQHDGIPEHFTSAR